MTKKPLIQGFNVVTMLFLVEVALVAMESPGAQKMLVGGSAELSFVPRQSFSIGENGTWTQHGLAVSKVCGGDGFELVRIVKLEPGGLSKIPSVNYIFHYDSHDEYTLVDKLRYHEIEDFIMGSTMMELMALVFHKSMSGFDRPDCSYMVPAIFAVFLLFLWLWFYRKPHDGGLIHPQWSSKRCMHSDWWLKVIRQLYPGREVGYTERLLDIGFEIRVCIGSASGGRFVVKGRSRHSFEDAWLALAQRLPMDTRNDGIQVQGVERLFGMKATPASRFVKEFVWFLWDFRKCRTNVERVVITLRWLDRVDDIAADMGLGDRFRDFFDCLQKTKVVSDYVKAQDSEAPIFFEPPRDVEGDCEPVGSTPPDRENLREWLTERKESVFSVLRRRGFEISDRDYGFVNDVNGIYSITMRNPLTGERKRVMSDTYLGVEIERDRFWNVLLREELHEYIGCMPEEFTPQGVDEKNPYSKLNEFLAKRGHSVVQRGDFEVVRTGPPHKPSFFVSFTVLGKTFEYQGNDEMNLTDCRVQAAAIALDHFEKSESTHIQPQGLGDTMSGLNLLLKGAFNSSSIRAGMKLISLIWHILFVFKDGKFDWDHLAVWETHWAKSSGEMLMNLGSNVMDQIGILASCASEFYVTRDPLVFLRNDTEVTKFLEDVEKLVGEVKLVPIQATLPDNMQSIEGRIHETILRGEALRPKVKAALRPPFTSGLIQLRALAVEISTMARSCSNRSAPFTLLMVGAPKIGKSSITSLLMAQFKVLNPKNTLAGNGLTLQDNGVYTRTLKEEYWSCYMNSYWGIIYDDLGQTNPKCPDFALEINEIIQVVNNAAFFPNMAGVDEKGKRYVAPQIVIANSNNRDLNAPHAVRSPGAVLRRFPYVVTPVVKAEFAHSDGSLNSTAAAGKFDLWTFSVDKVLLLANGNGVRYETVHENLSTAAFLAWFNTTATTHFREQMANDNFSNVINSSKCCDTCKLLQPFCSCAPRVFVAPEFIARRLFYGILFGALWQVMVVPIYSTYLLFNFMTHPLRYLTNWFLVLAFEGTAGMTSTMYLQSDPDYRWTSWLFRMFEPLADQSTMVDIFWLMGMQRTAARLNLWYVQSRRVVYDNRKIITAILAIVTAAVFMHWACKTLNNGLVPQWLDGVETGSPPEAPGVNIDNPWKQSKTPTFPVFLNGPSVTTSPDNFRKMLENSTAAISIPGQEVSIKSVNIFGQYWLLPRHYTEVTLNREFDKNGGWAMLHLTRSSAFKQKIFGSALCKVTRHDLHSCPDNDFAMLRLPTPPGPDLLPFLSSMPRGKPFDSEIGLIREEDGFVTVPTGAAIHKPFSRLEAITDLNGLSPSTLYDFFVYKSAVKTHVGDCGSPIFIAEKGRTTIVGFHIGVGGDESEKFGIVPPIAWLKKMKELAGPTCVVQGPVNLEKLDGKTIEVSDAVHSKCPLNFEGMWDAIGSSILPLGRLVNIPLNSFASKVAENAFAPFWREHGYSTDKVRPVTGKDHCPLWLPKRNFLLNATKQKDNLQPLLLKVALDHYRERLVKTMPPSELRKLRVIDTDTNLYGAPGNNFINAMEFDTGAGFPHNVPKHRILRPVSREGFPHGTFALTPQLQIRIDRAEDQMSRGERPGFIFNSSLKDEPISQKKLALGKIRVFQAICIEGLFLLRKYFLTLISLFQSFNFVSEAAIGMDATGPDWDDIHDYMFQPGWKIFCGDYSNYDQNMGSEVMMGAWKIFIDLARASGNFSSVSLKIMGVLATECCYPFVNFFGDLLLLNGSNPSGHGLTVNINSVVNSVYIRYAWLVIFGNLDDFAANVRVLTYGDDNMVAVSPKYQSTFNQVTVTLALAQAGITYTDAKKSGDAAPPFCEEHEISFLKRGFVLSEHGFWLAPLDVASIHKMLIIGSHSGKVQESDRLSSVLLNSVLEAFQHGRVFFDEHRALAVECARLHGLEHWLQLKGGLPTYELLLEKRLAKVSRQTLWRKLLA